MPRTENNDRFARSINRRSYLQQSAYGLGAIALSQLLGTTAHAAPANKEVTESSAGGAVLPLHFSARAKRVIHLCMAGGPSHLESFDNKPILKDHDGQAFPESLTAGQQLAQLQHAVLKARGPFTTFQKYGQSGTGNFQPVSAYQHDRGRSLHCAVDGDRTDQS